MHSLGCDRYRRRFIRIVFIVVFTLAAVMWAVSYTSKLLNNERKSAGKFALRVIVIVYNRASSLRRLLDSLNNAKYYGDSVTLEVWIDRTKDGIIDEQTYNFAKSFTFLHGDYHIFNHSHHSGIYGQWMGTWQAKECCSEIGVLLEDDLTVSPYFYHWLKLVHTKYDHMDYVNGFSLQGVSITHGIGAKMKYLDVNKKHRTFLYPIIGTWGFSPKVKNWLTFLNWYKESSKNLTFQPLVEGLLPSEWYKIFLQQGKEDTMWEMWHIYHAWTNKELTLYSNFPGNRGLAINWKEPGLHYSRNNNDINPDPILLDWKPEYEDLPEKPVIVDVNGVEMTPNLHPFFNIIPF